MATSTTQEKPSLRAAARRTPSATAPAEATTPHRSNGAVSKPVRAAAQATVQPDIGTIESVELSRIVIDPDQPRQEFSPTALQELADTIVGTGDKLGVGVLQPLLVVPHLKGYELVAGERRYRACKLAGLTHVPCYVRDLTRQQVSAARLIENDSREDLTAIERGHAYQRHLKQFGGSQEQLAKELGTTQAVVSNTLRLLKLPDEWQKLVMSQQITYTQARDLVSWCDLPKVLAHLKKELPKKKTFADLSPSEWGGMLEDAVSQAGDSLKSGKMVGNRYQHYDLTKVDKETRDQLDIRTYHGAYGDFELCFNTKLHTELVDAMLAKATKAEEAHRAKEVDGTKKTKTGSKPAALTPAQQKAQAAAEAQEKKKRHEQHLKRIYRYKLQWLQQQIIRRIDHLEFAEVALVLVGLTLTSGNNFTFQRRDALSEAWKEAGMAPYKDDRSHRGEVAIWEWMMATDRGKLQRGLLNFVRMLMGVEPRSWSSDANPGAIESIARTLGIDLALWKPDADFLSLHTIDQLSELAKEWKIAEAGSSKSGLIRVILEVSDKRKLTVPKELISVKPCFLD